MSVKGLSTVRSYKEELDLIGNENNGSGNINSWYGREIASTLGGAKNNDIDLSGFRASQL